ncbi:hypothetical protein I4L49_001489 [Enterococcus faecium]|nr:hypothetical protein [Enterococcus faecium]EMF0264485.1 hypothetical protein [Enterococcus hirae]EMF0428614.1 hypothetical protein [Enterococcus faecium]
MRYKNKVTGAVFDSSFPIFGENWAPVENEKKIEQSKKEEKTPQQDPPEVEGESSEGEEKQFEEEKTGDENFDSITIPQIKQELDAFGIEYNPRAKKQELYDLMMAQGE